MTLVLALVRKVLALALQLRSPLGGWIMSAKWKKQRPRVFGWHRVLGFVDEENNFAPFQPLLCSLTLVLAWCVCEAT